MARGMTTIPRAETEEGIMRFMIALFSVVAFSAVGNCAMDYRIGDVTLIIENEPEFDGALGGSIPVLTGGVTMKTYGGGSWYKTVFTLDMVESVGDNAGTAGYVSVQLYNFPPGAVFIAGGLADLDITATSGAAGDTGTMGVTSDFDGDIAFGTASYSAQGTQGTTLALTRDDIIPSTATVQAVDFAATGNCYSSSTESGTIWDGTTTAKDMWLNILIDDADQDVTTTSETLNIEGTLTIYWAVLGDY